MTHEECIAKNIDGIVRDKRYYILSKQKSEIYWQEVKATRVPNEYGLDLFIHEDAKDGYHISEGKTGMRMGKGLTKAACKRNFNRNMQIYNLSFINESINAAIQKHGASPRYILIENSLLPVKLLDKRRQEE